MKAESVLLFQRCFEPGRERLSAKVAQAFDLTDADVPDRSRLYDYTHSLLQNKKTCSPAVCLMLQFPELRARFDVDALLTRLVEDELESLGEKFCGALAERHQVHLVEECIARGRLKAALRASRLLGLGHAFPDLPEQYRQHTFHRLLGKGLIPAAASVAGEDRNLQEVLVKYLATDCGDPALAVQYCELFGLPVGTVEVSAEEITAVEKARLKDYLQMPLRRDSVVFVDSEALLRELAAPALHEAAAIGIDIEWQQWFTPAVSDDSAESADAVSTGDSAPASLLQMATHSQVFVLDLQALGGSPLLDQVLTPAMQASGTLKLGFELQGDLKKLRSSFPHMQAFRVVQPALEVRRLWEAYAQLDPKMAAARRRRCVGLSVVAQQVLGKPLDKSMQVSAWGRRPLTERQLMYAAMDAWVCVELHERMTKQPGGVSMAGVQAMLCTMTCNR